MNDRCRSDSCRERRRHRARWCALAAVSMLMLGGTWAQTPAGTDESPWASALDSAVRAARAKPDDTEALNRLQAALRVVGGHPVRQPLLAALAVGWRARGRAAECEHCRTQLRQLYPDSRYGFMISDAGLAEPCPRCHGQESESTPCESCKGTGSCPNSACREGVVTVEKFNGRVQRKPCPVCRGSQQCPFCHGRRKVSVTCPSCGGRGSLISRQRLLQSYGFILTDVLSILAGKEPTAPVPTPPPAVATTPQDASTVDAPATTTTAQGASTPPPAPLSIPRADPNGVPSELPREGHLSRTPEELQDLVREIGMWLRAQHSRLGGRIANRIYAGFENTRPVLYVELSDVLLSQPPEYRAEVDSALSMMWDMKCKASKRLGRRGKAAVRFVDSDGRRLN